MDRIKGSTVAGARDFFAEELKSVMEKHHVSANRNSFEYLVDLLLRHIESEKFFAKDAEGKYQNEVLAGLYSEYLGADVAKKKLVLQRLGDICLLVSGFFAESVHRQVVDLGYYFGMGGTAYQTLSQMQYMADSRAVYTELAEKFKPFSGVLCEMSERSGIQSNKDILRLYERWLFTGSDRLRAVLSEHGIAAPLKIDLKTKH